VLWVGLAGDLARLGALQATLAETLASVVPSLATRPFAPHLTLARRRGSARPSAGPIPWPPPRQMEALSIPFESFQLVQSVLSQSGPHYAPMASFSLGPNSASTS
jgi:2'-5' RNA ligase